MADVGHFMNMKILDSRIGTEYPIPGYMSDGAAAIDLYACLEEKSITIPQHTRKMIHTGIAVAIPQGYVGLLIIRSSIGAKHGGSMANCVGVVDSDYRGEILVSLECHSSDQILINDMARIAQLLIVPILRPKIEVVDELPETVRGEGGFGSTGV